MMISLESGLLAEVGLLTYDDLSRELCLYNQKEASLYIYNI